MYSIFICSTWKKKTKTNWKREFSNWKNKSEKKICSKSQSNSFGVDNINELVYQKHLLITISHTVCRLSRSLQINKLMQCTIRYNTSPKKAFSIFPHMSRFAVRIYLHEENIQGKCKKPARRLLLEKPQKDVINRSAKIKLTHIITIIHWQRDTHLSAPRIRFQQSHLFRFVLCAADIFGLNATDTIFNREIHGNEVTHK